MYFILLVLLWTLRCSAQTQQELREMLNWAMNNSDPEKLKEMAAEYKAKNQTVKDTMGETLETFMKKEEDNSDDGDYLDVVLKLLQNDSSPASEIVPVLRTTQELMEDIDVAFYAKQLGLLEALYNKAFDERPDVASLAAWSLGSAMQNVPQVQNDFLSLDDCTSLQKLIRHLTEQKECSPRLLFALSCSMRGNATTIAEADAHGLFTWAWKQLGDPDWPAAVKAMSMLFSVVGDAKTDWVDRISDDPLTPILQKARESQKMEMYEKVVSLMYVLRTVAPVSFRRQWSEASAKAIADCDHVWDAETCLNLHDIVDGIGYSQQNAVNVVQEGVKDDTVTEEPVQTTEEPLRLRQDL